MCNALWAKVANLNRVRHSIGSQCSRSSTSYILHLQRVQNALGILNALKTGSVLYNGNVDVGLHTLCKARMLLELLSVPSGASRFTSETIQ